MITQIKFLQLLPLLLVVVLVSLRPVSGRTPGKNTDNEHSQLSSSGVESGGSRIRCSDREKEALLKFKEELIDKWGILSSWGNEENKKECCKWRGVRCHNRTNHVIALDLNAVNYSSALKGNISSSLLKLQQLQNLDLNWNDFGHRPIPKFIGSLTNLRYLNLRYSGLSGPIPHHIGNLSKLVHLDLSGNDQYSESLDWVSSLHSLEHLILPDTNLSKATEWLQDISKLTSLKELHLSGNMLVDMPTASLPKVNASNSPLTVLDLSRSVSILNSSYGSSVFFHGWALIRWFSNFSTCGLTSIDLRGMSMPGPIPHVFQNVDTLEKLSLSLNDLEGGIPSYFGNMSSLTELNLNWNNLTGEFSELVMNLSGPVEKKLEHLQVDRNKIKGSFSDMSRFSSLVFLSLKENLLSGSIPEGYLSPPNLQYLDLSSNQLIGSIPEGYLSLPNLQYLDLSSNQLTGSLPDLSFSSSLEYLYLYNNTFNDTLPQSIGRLSNLRTLWLGSNLIKGVITESFMSNLSHLRALDLSLNSNLSIKFDPQWVPPFQLKSLSLRHIKLGPEFPLWLKTQTQLTYIDLSNAGISNVFPGWFIAPKVIYMNASNNQMHGVIPELSFSIDSYRDLQLAQDRLSYGITLDLSSNRISGSVIFLCKVKEWKFIDLSDNLLFDRIPNCFANFEGLRYLKLSNNHLFGRIPHLFGSLSALRLLQLRNNNFSGELPASMGNCTHLNTIDLGENRLTGEIPGWIGERFSDVRALILRSNKFHGRIPSNLCNSTSIQILDLSSNKISGSIPECVCNYSRMIENDNYSDVAWYGIWWYYISATHSYEIEINSFEDAYFTWKGKETLYTNQLGIVTLLDLSNNNLVGEIPAQITQLAGLVGLNLSRNNLTGPIPENIGQLRSLNFLDFSRNHLSGGIPTKIDGLNSLGILNLSYNNLSGRIPESGHALTHDKSSYIGNSGLCGKVINKSCPGDEPHQTPSIGVSKVQFEDDEIISGGFYLAVGLGFFFGFWGLFGTILLNKDMRRAFFQLLDTVGDFFYVRVELTKARLIRYFQNW